MKSAAVIIGCWAIHQQPIHRTLVKNIVDYINCNTDIETVLLSNKRSHITNHWADVESRIFFDEQGVTWVREQWQKAKQINSSSNTVETDPLILNQNWNNKQCISISEQWQLEYLLNHDLQDIQSVWYFGIGFNFGLRRDDIGWGHLCDLIRFNHVKPVDIMTRSDLVTVHCEPFSGRKPPQCDFEHPDFSGTDWKEVSPKTYKKTSLTWDHSAVTDFIPTR